MVHSKFGKVQKDIQNPQNTQYITHSLKFQFKQK